MNKFKQISLILASLFIFALAVSSQTLYLKDKTYFQNQDQCVSAFLADDVDVDLSDEQISNIHQIHFVQLLTPFTLSQGQSFALIAPESNSQLPFYLKIQSLRI